jgi:DNA-binding transcriptional regulator YiaG
MTPDQLKRARRRLGLKQTELAAQLGVHPLTVSRWERGTTTITAPVTKLIEVLVKQHASVEAQARKKRRVDRGLPRRRR